jgi:uncharacterized protein
MATVSFRIEDELKNRLERLAEREGLNVSHLFRQVLAEKVDELECGGNERASLPLSIKERLMLANQYRVLAVVTEDKETADSYRRHGEALESGYELHYRDLVQNFADGMSQDLSIEVLDILAMYDDLAYSFKQLKSNEGIKENDVRFFGFDENYESDQFRYAHYVLDEHERFVNLQANNKRYGVNSHAPMLARYRRMLSVWRDQQRMPQPLSAVGIKAILASGSAKKPG